MQFTELHGHRTLAAIVFTDGVSFSRRMAQDEDNTLRLLHRDFKLMRQLCSQFEGQVIKSTGDGLLMYFCSAVQAVGCAQEIQRKIASKNKRLPSAERLEHRIGIHLGDVFLMNDDVMGDGVNIAARLQAEAEPGGICISQTVYDVVKNRLSLKTTYLGPRELKNIREAIPIYQILLAAQTEIQTPERLTDVPLMASHQQPADDQQAMASASATPTVIEAAMATRDQLKAVLVKMLGPASDAVLGEVLQEAHSFEELMALLVKRLPSQQQHEFKTKVAAIHTQIQAAQPLETRSVGPHPQRSLHVSVQTRQKLETLLQNMAGPVGVVLLRQIMAIAHSEAELLKRLAAQIPRKQRREFLAAAQLAFADSPDPNTANPPSQSPKSPKLPPAQRSQRSKQPAQPAPPSSLDVAFIQQCREVLLQIIGPIAPLLLQKALAQHPHSPLQLVKLICRQLPDAETVHEFQTRLEQHTSRS